MLVIGGAVCASASRFSIYDARNDAVPQIVGLRGLSHRTNV